MRVQRIVAGLLVVGFCAESPVRAQEQFNHGDIFISLTYGKACFSGVEETLLRIDPVTGEGSVFATSDDGLCYPTGLRFTSDGQRLFVVNGTLAPLGGPPGGAIQSFAPNGESEILYNGDDGLSDLFGSNGLAFDTDENLYVVSAGGILRFPVGGGPATVFASDGISSRGVLDFARNGDLFYGSILGGTVIRITPEGEISIFDKLPGIQSLVFDKRGNFFVASGSTVYRYDAGNPDARRVLATGFPSRAGVPNPLAVSADGRILYLADDGSSVHAIDADEGSSKVVFDLAAPGGGGYAPLGMTVYIDPCVPIEGITPDCDGNGVSDGCDIVVGRSADCGGDGVPDECAGCLANCECDDREVCTFDQCINGACSSTGALYADIAGDSGTCGPDGVVDLGDIIAVLDGFQGVFAEGCARHNIDITGDTHCVPDGTIDLQDILAVLDAFSGTGDCVCDP